MRDRESLAARSPRRRTPDTSVDRLPGLRRLEQRRRAARCAALGCTEPQQVLAGLAAAELQEAAGASATGAGCRARASTRIEGGAKRSSSRKCSSPQDRRADAGPRTARSRAGAPSGQGSRDDPGAAAPAALRASAMASGPACRPGRHRQLRRAAPGAWRKMRCFLSSTSNSGLPSSTDSEEPRNSRPSAAARSGRCRTPGLRVAVQVDQQVAAGDQVQPGETASPSAGRARRTAPSRAVSRRTR